MTAYESLNRVRHNHDAYVRMLDRVEYLTALSQRVTPVLSGLPKGEAQHGATDEPWARLADYKTDCKWALTDYISSCRQLEKELECIKSTRIRTAMNYRYVDLKKVETIAELMEINERNVYRLLKRGRQIYEYHFDRGEV